MNGTFAAVLLALAMCGSLALAAFCAAMETGFMSVSRGRIMHLVREGSAAARIVQKALARMSRTLTALLVGNNFAAVTFSTSSAALADTLFRGSSLAHGVWTAAAAFAILYLGEFLPKLFFSSRPLSRLVRAAAAYRVFDIAMRPVTAFAMWITGFFIPKGDKREKVTANDLVLILQDRKNGVRLTDFECALVTRIVVMRRKGENVTVDGLLRAIDDEPSIP